MAARTAVADSWRSVGTAFERQADMANIQELELLVTTRTPLILVEPWKRRASKSCFRRLTTRTGRPLFRWALATGLQALEPPATAMGWWKCWKRRSSFQYDRRSCQKPADVLQYVLQSRTAAMFLLLDLHRVFDDPVILSQLQEIAARREQVAHTLALVGAELTVPNELRSFAARFELTLRRFKNWKRW